LSKKTVDTILSWGVALAVALLIANAVSFAYRSGAGSIQRANAFSTSIRTPNTVIVRGAEGYGINAVDERGYLNDNTLPLKEHYILMMGSSHAEGLQIMQEDTMTSVLNRMLDPNERTVYNIGTAGQTFPLIVEGFRAAMEEFPDAAGVMMEISRLEFSEADFARAMDQAEYDPASSGIALEQSLGFSRRLRNNILGVLPVISQLRQQFDSMDFSMRDAFGIAALLEKNKAAAANEAAPSPATSAPAAQTGESAYAARMNQVFALLRSEFDGPILILYHSGVMLLPDGTLLIKRETEYYDDFKQACENNGIILLDASDAFLRAYEADYSLPYGFNNTTMASGHLNTLGHRLLAEEFYKAWMQIQDKEKN
jgi:hypothetical protein